MSPTTLRASGARLDLTGAFARLPGYCTYKTNRYHMLLPNVVGINSEGMTLNAAFVWLSSECAAEYTYAMHKFQEVIGEDVRARVDDDDEQIGSDNQVLHTPTTHKHMHKYVGMWCMWRMRSLQQSSR